MANLPGRCWMDADGRHVWWEHQCVRNEIRRDMLPWPFWKSNGELQPSVTPSIVCMVNNCEFHSTPLITSPPDDWKPRLTHEEVEGLTTHDSIRTAAQIEVQDK